MSESSRYPKPSDRWANELWNLTLLPLAPADETELAQRRLENRGEQSASSISASVGPLRMVVWPELTLALGGNRDGLIC